MTSAAAGCKTVAIGRAFGVAPWADWWIVLSTCDLHGRTDLETLPCLISQVVWADNGPPPGTFLLPDPDWPDRPEPPPAVPSAATREWERLRDARSLARGPCPRCGESGRCRTFRSGWAAIEAVIAAGARRILLLGFVGGPDALGRGHFFEAPGTSAWDAENGPRAMECWRVAAHKAELAGVEIVNCSPGTMIDAFATAALEDALR